MSPRRASPRSILELLCWTAAALCFGLVLWSFGDAALYQQRAARLLQEAPAAPSGPSAAAPGPLGPPAHGAPLSHLQIPRLGIDAFVAEGDSEDVLRRAIGHVPESALPGQRGNVALAGHRDTFFRGLGAIRVGDLIELRPLGASGDEPPHRYRVDWTRVVEPTAVDVLAPSTEHLLTLVTCYPFRWIGPAPQRFIVRASLLPAEPGRFGPVLAAQHALESSAAGARTCDAAASSAPPC